MPVREGDFVLIEYELWTKDTNQLISTTDEELAKKHGVYSESERYGPYLVIVGEGRIIKGIEEAIVGKEEGEEFEVEIPPEKGFGRRDPSKVKSVPLNVFLREKVRPEPGSIIRYQGRPAVIRSVTGGRVVLDFNHPFAGRTLRARVRVVKILRSPEEKVKYLLLRRAEELGEDDVKTSYDPGEKLVRVELSEKALDITDLQLKKKLVVLETAKYLAGEVERIVFVESAVIPAPTEEASTASRETPEEAAEQEQPSR